MNDTPNGGPAFPRSPATVKSWEDGDEREYTYHVTLRDYFAAKALPQIIANYSRIDRSDAASADVAKACYLVADAMLAARDAAKETR